MARLSPLGTVLQKIETQNFRRISVERICGGSHLTIQRQAFAASPFAGVLSVRAGASDKRI
jgi:hypothetical protein